jgi:hypothetical protein
MRGEGRKGVERSQWELSASWERHGPSVKNDKQHKGLRKKGMSKSRAAAISNSPEASSKGGKSSGSSQGRRSRGSGGNQSRKKAAGHKGGKKSK